MFRKNTISLDTSDLIPARARSSIAWRLLLPVPITIIIAVALIWLTVPRLVTSVAINDATLAGRSLTAQFKAIRGYYTQNVVNKVVAGGAFKASFDHKNSP